MSKNTSDSDESDVATSSSEQDSSDKESDNNESDCEGRPYRSLTFSRRGRRPTTHLKSKKTGKRVRFKPGDSLVLIYVIPNREMLGLKSASEDSDEYYEESDEESEDEGNEDENVESSDDDDEEDDDDVDLKEDSEDDTDDEDDEENETDENKNLKKKPKPYATLMAARHTTKHRSSLLNMKSPGKTQERTTKQLINLNLINEPPKVKKRNKKLTKRKEKKDKQKPTSDASPENKSRTLRRKQRSASVEKEKPGKFKRSRSRIIEINATIDSKSVGTPAVPRVLYKNNVLDVNGASVSQNGGKPLTQRGRMQTISLRAGVNNARPKSAPKPSSVRIVPPRPNSAMRRSVSTLPNIADKLQPAGRVMSTSYESLTSVLPDSYKCFSSKDLTNRLDPDCMNSDSKRHYGWQIANGTITSQSLRTPSILPFWDSLQGQVTDKLPT